MSTDGQHPGDPTTDPALEAVEADLAQTRQHLAETVDELAARADVKTRSREALAAKKAQLATTASHTRERVTMAAGEATVRARTTLTDDQGRPSELARRAGIGAALAVAATLTVLLWRRRR